MILRFILFLISIFAFFAISRVTSKRVSLQRPIMSSELLIISGSIFIIIFPYLLSGFFDLKLYVFIFGGLQASVILSSVLIFVLGTKEPQKKLLSRFVLHYLEIVMNHPIIYLVTICWILIVLIGYFIFVSYVYFTNPFGSQEAIKPIMVATLLYGFLATTPLLIIFNLSALTSKNIDRDTRNYIFCYSFGGIVPPLIYLSIPFLFLGIEYDKIIFAVGGVKLTILYMLLIAFMLYFVFFTVIPQAYGMQAHKRARIADYNTIISWLDKVIEAFRHPRLPDMIDKLTNIKNELEREIAHYKDENPWIESYESQEVESLGLTADVLELDKRFVYYDFLEKMRRDILNLINIEYKTVSDPYLLITYSTNDKDTFSKKKHNYEEEMRGIKEQKWVGTITISIIFSAILAALVGKYSISIANYLKTIIS